MFDYQKLSSLPALILGGGGLLFGVLNLIQGNPFGLIFLAVGFAVLFPRARQSMELYIELKTAWLRWLIRTTLTVSIFLLFFGPVLKAYFTKQDGPNPVGSRAAEEKVVALEGQRPPSASSSSETIALEPPALEGSWHEGGTLEQSHMDAWKRATSHDKHATTAHLMAGLMGVDAPDELFLNTLRPNVDNVVHCVDRSSERPSVKDAQLVAVMVEVCMVRLDLPRAGD